MARRRLIWSNPAKIDLRTLLEYYDKRNGSTAYSKALYKRILKLLDHVRTHGHYGQSIGKSNIRFILVRNIQANFEVKDEEVLVFAVFDARRDPEELKKYRSRYRR